MGNGASSWRSRRVMAFAGAAVSMAAVVVTTVVWHAHDDGLRETGLVAGADPLEQSVPVPESTLPLTIAPSDAPTTVAPPPPAAPSTNDATSPTTPVLKRATADWLAHSITLTYDQPVDLGTAMYLVVYGRQATCGTPDGNAHYLLSGGGTATITVEASSLVPGTDYVTIVAGFVVGTNGRLPNVPTPCTAVQAGEATTPRYKGVEADAGGGTVTIAFDQLVQPGDASKLTAYGNDSTCRQATGTATSVVLWDNSVRATITGLTTGITYLRIGKGLVSSPSSGMRNEASPCISTIGFVSPALVGATAHIDGQTVTLTVTFDQPVTPGKIDMYLMLHDGPSCPGPNGNSHQLLSGGGTDTLTVTTSGYVAGKTNYLTIAEGFVYASDDHVANRYTTCTPIAVA